MTAVKIRVGLLYEQSDAETCKRLRTELTKRCRDVDITADVFVDDIKGLLSARAALRLFVFRCG